MIIMSTKIIVKTVTRSMEEELIRFPSDRFLLHKANLNRWNKLVPKINSEISPNKIGFSKKKLIFYFQLFPYKSRSCGY